MQRTAGAQALKKPGPGTSPPQPGPAAGVQHSAARLMSGSNQANQAMLRQFMGKAKDGPAEAPMQSTGPPEFTDADETQMQHDMDILANQLKTQSWTSTANHDFIMMTVRYWCTRDEEYTKATGYQGTPYLDRLLRKMKSRTINMGDFLADRHMLLYDALWHLQDGDVEEYKALVKRSRTEGLPPVGPQDSGVMGLTKSLGVSGLGFVQGASKGLAGVADSVTWLASVVTGNDKLKTDLAGKVEKQYNDLGKEVLGENWTDGAEVMFGMKASDLSSGIGNIAISVALSMSGNIAWLGNASKVKWVNNLKTILKGAAAAQNILNNVKTAGEAIEKCNAVALQLAEQAYLQHRELTWQDLLSNSEFQMHLINAVTNTVGSITGIPTKSFEGRLAKELALASDILAAGGMGARLVDIFTSDLSSEKKWAAAKPVLFDFVTKLAQAAIGTVNYHKEFVAPKPSVPEMPQVAPAAPKVKQPRVDRRQVGKQIRKANNLENANQNAALRAQKAQAKAARKAARNGTAPEAEPNVRPAPVEAPPKAQAEPTKTVPTSGTNNAPTAGTAPKTAPTETPSAHASETDQVQARRAERKAEENRWKNAQTDPADPRHDLLKQGLSLKDGRSLAKAGITPDRFAEFGIVSVENAQLVAKLARENMQPEHLSFLLKKNVTLKDLKDLGYTGQDIGPAARLFGQAADRLKGDAVKRLAQKNGAQAPVQYMLNLIKHERSGIPRYGDVKDVLRKAGFASAEDRALLRVAAQSGTLEGAERAALEQATDHILQRMESVGASKEIKAAVKAYGQNADILRLAYMDDMMKTRAAGTGVPIPDAYSKPIDNILNTHGVTAIGDLAAVNSLPFESLPPQHQKAVIEVRKFWEDNMRQAVASGGALMHKEVNPNNIVGMLYNPKYQKAALGGYWSWAPAATHFQTPADAFHQMALGYFATGFSPEAPYRFFVQAKIGPQLAERFTVPMSEAARNMAGGIKHLGEGNGNFPSTLNGHLAARKGFIPEWVAQPGDVLPDGAKLMVRLPEGKVVELAEVIDGKWAKKMDWPPKSGG